MRPTLTVLALIATLGSAPVATAQQVEPSAERRISRVFLGGQVMLAQPVGDFGDLIDKDAAFGFGGHLIYRLDRAGMFGIRVDAGSVIYGDERERVCFSPTVGCRVELDVRTNNNVALFGIGPQFMLPTGEFRPYVAGTVGLAYFFTESRVEERRSNLPFARTTNFDDPAFAFGGSAGLYIPVGRGRTPISIDVGLRYHHNSEAAYLREGSIRDNPDGSIDIFPIRSDADLILYQVGVSIGVGR
jgi:hypothetical protein